MLHASHHRIWKCIFKGGWYPWIFITSSKVFLSETGFFLNWECTAMMNTAIGHWCNLVSLPWFVLRRQQFHSSTIAFVPPIQVSARWNSLATSKCYCQNSFDLTSSVQGPQGPTVFADRTFRTAAQIHCPLSSWARRKWLCVAQNKALLIKTQNLSRAQERGEEMWTERREPWHKVQAFFCLWNDLYKESLPSRALNS